MTPLNRSLCAMACSLVFLPSAALADTKLSARVAIDVNANNQVLESRVRGLMTEALRKIDDVRIVSASDHPFFEIHVWIVELKTGETPFGWTASYTFTTNARIGETDVIVEEYSGSGVVYSDYSEEHSRQTAFSVVEKLDSSILLSWRSMTARKSKTE